jgi:hypothetical protein
MITKFPKSAFELALDCFDLAAEALDLDASPIHDQVL